MSAERAPGGIVPGYAGHADVQSRRLSDQQVRAWVGEILAELMARVPLDGVRGRVDALLLRCEFGNQHVIKAIEDVRFSGPALAELVEEQDRKLIAAASAGPTTGPDGLAAFIEGLERAFEERAAAITSGLKR
jgi:hypothetical protein